MLIIQATLANWQCSIHGSLCEYTLHKSQACVSSLLSFMWTTRVRESLSTALFYSLWLTSLFFFVALTESAELSSAVALLRGWHCGLETWPHPDSLHHHVSFHRSLGLQNKRHLSVLTMQLTSLAWAIWYSFNEKSIWLHKCFPLNWVE